MNMRGCIVCIELKNRSTVVSITVLLLLNRRINIALITNLFTVQVLLVNMICTACNVFFQTKSHLIMSIGGWLMIVMGVLLYFDMMTKIIAWFTPFFGGFTGF
ncbi:hypothetical protein HR49_01400 [Lysinibacillus fusiformis]|jgi:hypothetical protein|uniref:Uncharacterized protein n=1 Tax=Lysinibacillus macroides TaxID=33935 RepID=A0A0N1J011_9BACI|nr:hypothetical protein HR49_01400 [Lysinibacillus fusiformis]KOY80215.1 hypothetical protein ADM90_20375 [Lysinibacillus macroides]